MKFDQAVAIILKFEGGLVNNDHDSGGVTKYGISKRAYPKLDIINLTKTQAIDIYKSDYWDKLSLNSVPEKLRLAIFDAAVNQGPAKAVMMIQKLLGVPVDGIMGTKTLQAFGVDGSKLLDSYIMARHDAYTRSQGWLYFGKGWSRRILEIALTSLS